MKNSRIALLVACALAASAWSLVPGPARAQAAADPAPAALTKDQGSYLIGLQYADQLARGGVGSEVSVDAIAQGLRDGLAGKAFKPEDRAALRDFGTALMKAAADRNAAAARDFLAANAKAKGVVTTASGLQYRIVSAGDAKAAPPAQTDQVTVHYRGTLLDGKEFDSSYARNQPATFPVNGVIQGWQEALVLMRPGSKWQLWIPPQLGYDNSPKPGIPPGSALVFDVELLSINKPDAAAPSP